MIEKIMGSMPNLLPNFISVDETKNTGLNFGEMVSSGIESIEKNQIETKNNFYNVLTTGEGSTQDALISMQKATSQIKTMAVVRDKFVENYQSIMSMQI